MKPAIGTILDDKYRIVRELGTGGMGAVYEGENVRIRRKVAIKLLHAGVSSQAEAVMRFEREAEAAGRIGSDHICEVIDLGILPDGTRYMVMEYLEGETLGARIKRSGRMGPLMSIPIMAQVLDALAAAHAAGIIHRDLKPDNIFLLHSKGGMIDFVKILDFGVSKFAQNSDEMNMTRAGAVVGTPYYMSPEQARGTTSVDARSDIYALGVLLYQTSTGQVPFQAQTFNELLFKIVLEPAPPPQHYAPDLDPDFSAIITKAMAREPAQRFQTCAEFKEALLTWMTARVGHAAMPLAGVRAGTLPPNAGILHPPPTAAPSATTPPLQHLSAPPWAGASQSEAAMHGHSPSGGGAQGTQTPQTSNAWGHASQSGQLPRPSRSGLAIGAISVAVIVLLGGAGLAIFMRSGKPPAQTEAAATQTAQATSEPTAEPPATTTTAVEPPPTDPTASADASSLAASSASAAPAVPPATSAAHPPGPTAAPSGTLGRGKLPTTPTTKPTSKPGPPGDFGY